MKLFQLAASVLLGVVVASITMAESRAVSHDILSFSARVLNTTASVGALNSFEG